MAFRRGASRPDGMTLPSATLLAQSALSGVFIGSLYGLLGLGLSLSWGLLHVINLAHFGFAFLAAYLCYQLASVGGIDPLLTLLLIVPLFALLGIAVQWLLARFSVSPLNSAQISAACFMFWTNQPSGCTPAIINISWPRSKS